MPDDLDTEMFALALIFADILDATIEFCEELQELGEEVADGQA